MTKPDREAIMAVVDALIGGERIALLVGNGVRPVEVALTAAFAAWRVRSRTLFSDVL